jgi:hypothetical protein
MKTSIKVLHWTPRIICILAIVFISLFTLDSFRPDLTIWQQIGEFLIHLIPSFIFVHNYKMNDSIWISLVTIMMITIPFIIVGILFIVSHFKKRSQNPAQEVV